MAKDWGLEWRLVPPKGRESCRWQSVDNAWVSLTLGHQGDITRIVVASSDGRSEVVEGYEEALNVARRWRSSWVSRRSGPPLPEDPPPSFPSLPTLPAQKSRASRSGRSLSNPGLPGFLAPSFGSAPHGSSHSSNRPGSDSAPSPARAAASDRDARGDGDTGRQRQAIPPRPLSRSTQPPLLPPLEPEPPTQIIGDEPTVALHQRHTDPTRVLPASPVSGPRSPGSTPSPSPRSSLPPSSPSPRSTLPLSSPSPRPTPPPPSPSSPTEDPGPTTSRRPGPRRRF